MATGQIGPLAVLQRLPDAQDRASPCRVIRLGFINYSVYVLYILFVRDFTPGFSCPAGSRALFEIDAKVVATSRGRPATTSTPESQ